MDARPLADDVRPQQSLDVDFNEASEPPFDSFAGARSHISGSVSAVRLDSLATRHGLLAILTTSSTALLLVVSLFIASRRLSGAMQRPLDVLSALTMNGGVCNL